MRTRVQVRQSFTNFSASCCGTCACRRNPSRTSQNPSYQQLHPDYSEQLHLPSVPLLPSSPSALPQRLLLGLLTQTHAGWGQSLQPLNHHISPHHCLPSSFISPQHKQRQHQTPGITHVSRGSAGCKSQAWCFLRKPSLPPAAGQP